jgi:hypothetical protein
MRDRAHEPEEDHVRTEIEAALRRGTNVVVIPSLVGNAALPTAEQLALPRTAEATSAASR